MKGHDARLEPELEALLTPRKIERQAPAEVRARALARAQAFVAGGQLLPFRPSPGRLPRPALTRTLGPLQFALLASMAVAGGAVGTAITLSSRHAEPVPVQAPAPARPSARAPQALPAASSAPVLVVQPPVPSAAPARAAQGTSEGDPFAAELGLLARAQAAYTHHDFSRALALVAEHARPFPNRHLAEEREALRVRSLLGSGLHEEAERSAAVFARRFPRSVLLPRGGESLSTK